MIISLRTKFTHGKNKKTKNPSNNGGLNMHLFVFM